jgi:hypothetical protein
MPNYYRDSVFFFVLVVSGFIGFKCEAQIDPIHRNLIELGYDQPLVGQGPQGIYAYYYYNNPEFVKTNIVLRAAIAPVYLDSELGFKQLISPTTDVGIGVSGGAYSDNYYEVRQGKYIKSESFDGDGGKVALSIYQLCDPGFLIPLNLVLRGGLHYATYSTADQTSGQFTLPPDQVDAFTRTGLRLAGKEPLLFPALAMELSVWYERQWRFQDGPYGFNGDRRVNSGVSLYWLYADLDYAFTNSGQRVSFSFTAGGSDDADRLSAWRLGGVLPLISEFPLMIPGYYYEELTAESFVDFYGAYDIPLDKARRFDLRLEAATAHVNYLPGFEQPSDWQSGVGCGLAFSPKRKNFKIVLRYGYGFNAVRHDDEGAQSIGLLFQYNFEPRKTHSE